MSKIKVLIADDQSIIRNGLKLILEMEDDIEVVGLAGDGNEAYEMTKNASPDVILMDIRMPGCDGVMGTKKINEDFDVKIIILTTFLEDEYIFEALKYGAKGYLLKDVDSGTLADSIRTVAEGNVLIHPAALQKLVSGIGAEKKVKNEEIKAGDLTAREIDIARLIGKGNSNKEIGKLLFISEGTVKNHITNILSKLDLRDRTQIAVFAVENLK